MERKMKIKIWENKMNEDWLLSEPVLNWHEEKNLVYLKKSLYVRSSISVCRLAICSFGKSTSLFQVFNGFPTGGHKVLLASPLYIYPNPYVTSIARTAIFTLLF